MWPPPPNSLAIGVDVDVALRAHAHAPVAGAVLLEEHDRENLLHRQREIDEPFGVLVGAAAVAAPAAGPRTASRSGPSHRAASGSSTAPNSFRRPRLLLSKMLRGDRRRVDAGLHALAADVERPRRDVRVVERAGVGQDRDVDVRRDLRRERHAELAIRSNTISPHAAADRSNQFSAPYIVLPG